MTVDRVQQMFTHNPDVHVAASVFVKTVLLLKLIQEETAEMAWRHINSYYRCMKYIPPSRDKRYSGV